MPSPDATSRSQHARTVRRGALRLLYQIDVRGERDAEAIRDDALAMGGVEPDEADDLPALTTEQAQEAFELALGAHQHRRAADQAVAEYAPEWPAHRQPAIDRAILRLAHYEMTTGRVHPKIAVNEGVELAKQFGGERSPAFVNAVLDKLLKRTPAASEPGGEAGA